jgi:hypothetical protein
MRIYRGKSRSDFYAPYGTCRKCGWTGQDWGFKYHGYCKKCYSEWRKEQAERRRRLKPPNENIEVAGGIIVTRNVQIRLEKQAKHDVPHTTKEIICISVLVFCGSVSWISLLLFLVGLNTHQEYTFSAGTCAVVCFVVASIFGWMGGNEARKRISKLDARLEELARERQKRIEEAIAFYSSPEWRLLREQVIKEQGRLCQECRCEVAEDYDLTVDHIKPRSKYPELALDKSNLQVLCRSCNSTKGATYNEASISTQLTTRQS